MRSSLLHREFLPRAPTSDDPVKPVASFCWLGPAALANGRQLLALADVLYGGERNMIPSTCRSFRKPYGSTLKGSPPGYVGYGEGGVLTEAVRRRPYSLCCSTSRGGRNPDVLELFFQFRQRQDGRWRWDARSTSATPSFYSPAMRRRHADELCADPETMPDSLGMLQALKPELNKIFKPALSRQAFSSCLTSRWHEALKQIIG